MPQKHAGPKDRTGRVGKRTRAPNNVSRYAPRITAMSVAGRSCRLHRDKHGSRMKQASSRTRKSEGRLQRAGSSKARAMVTT